MRRPNWVFAAALFTSAGVVWGQTPVIKSVTNLLGQPVISPSGAAQIFGTWPVDAARNWSVTVGSAQGRVGASWVVRNIATELDIEVPAEVPVGPSTVVISHPGGTSTAFPITIVPVTPVIPFDPFNAFVHMSGLAVNPTSPAAPGELITTIMTGLGVTNPPTPTGTSTTSFILTAGTVTVTVGGETAQLQFAGLYPGGRAGIYQVSFTVPSDAATGALPVVISIGGVSSNTQSLFVGTQALGSPPVISGVANGASFSTTAELAPGSFFSVFASGLGSADNLSAFPATTVNGISVLVNGKLAPIFHLIASKGQINALVPGDVSIGSNMTVVVQNQNGPSRPAVLSGGAAGPGIFVVQDPTDSTHRNAAATLANSAWLAMPASQTKALGLTACAGLSPVTLCGQPVHPGDFVQLYVTGLGKATPNGDPNGAVLPTGQVAPVSGNPIYATVALPTVTVGNLAAKVVFSGLAPGFAGLYQVDFQVPSNVTAGDRVAVQISMPGSVTDSATIAIAAQ